MGDRCTSSLVEKPSARVFFGLPDGFCNEMYVLAET